MERKRTMLSVFWRVLLMFGYLLVGSAAMYWICVGGAVAIEAALAWQASPAERSIWIAGCGALLLAGGYALRSRIP